MLIQSNPIYSIGHGCATITGVCSEASYSLQWWFTDAPGTVYTSGFTITGTAWVLDILLSSSTDSISIRAVAGPIYSNELVISLATNHDQPLPTFQSNEFDDLGYENDLDRYILEPNTYLKKRILDVYTNPGSSTRLGLLNGVERELLLPHLDPFFYLSIRFDPRTGKAYDESVQVFFEPYRVAIQLNQWVVRNEPIDVDPTTSQFIVAQVIGSENESTGNVIQIYNGTSIIPRNWFQQIGDKSFQISLDKIDPTKVLTITYPYRQVFEYTDGTTEHTVLDVKTFLEGVATVTDEDSVTRPLIVWNNGTITPVASIPAGSSTATFLFYQKAVDCGMLTGADYYQITGNKTDKYFQYVNPFSHKGYFSALDIVPRFAMTLTTTPVAMRGSLLRITKLSDKEFQDRLHTNTGGSNYSNLRYYANELQKLTKMGIRRAIVDADEWNSDSAANIGDNFLPSEFDGGRQDFGLVGNSGVLEFLTLNQRKHLIKILATQT